MALYGISLNGASAVGPGLVVTPDHPTKGSDVSMSLYATGDSAVTFEPAFEATIDGQNWIILNDNGSGSWGTTYSPTFLLAESSSLNAVFTAFRANLKSITWNGGSALSVTCAIAILPPS